MRPDLTEPVYVISVAAKLVAAHPQTLRLYERVGLLKPARTENNIRLYSGEDIERLRQIQRLLPSRGGDGAGNAAAAAARLRRQEVALTVPYQRSYDTTTLICGVMLLSFFIVASAAVILPYL